MDTSYSIIIPCYNAVDTIKETVKCILNEMAGVGVPFEIIIVDDGSNDGTPQILDEIQSRNCNITVYSKNNGGVSSARNFGLQFAKYQYVWYFDADDLIFKGSVQEINNLIAEYNPDILQVSSVTVDRRTKHNIDNYNNTHSYNILYSGKYSEYLRNHTVCLACWGQIVKREILVNKQVLFDEQLAFFEDFAWSLNLANEAASCNYILTDLQVVKYMLRADSAINSTNSKTNRKLLESIFEFDSYMNSLASNVGLDSCLSYSIAEFKSGIVNKKMITRFFSCRMTYKENLEYIKRINRSLMQTQLVNSRIINTYKCISKSVILTMLFQLFYRTVFLNVIKPFLARN